MKRYFYLLLFISLNSLGQNLYLKIKGASDNETKKIDSLGYRMQHLNAKSVLSEVALFSDRIIKLGYLQSKLEFEKLKNDSVFEYKVDLLQKTDFIHIYIGANERDLANAKQDSLIIKFEENESFLKNILKKLESKGFSMAKVTLENLSSDKNYISTKLKIVLDKKRELNDIIINGYEKFPAGHLKNLKRLYKNKIFNSQNLEQLQKDVGQFRFVKQIKYPEILFTRDSTKIYVYLDKAKNNTFDGFLGFTNNDKKKLIFSGYIDLVLHNILHSGEKLILNWRSNGQEQSTFTAAAEIPYVFKSPIGIKANLNIIKQDSTFQTTQTAVDFGYYLNYNTRLYLGYQSSESSDIKNKNTALISDFNNEFVTGTFEYLNFKNDSYLFPEKTNLNFKIGSGKRTSKTQNNSQFYGNIFLKHDFYLNAKNCITVKSENFYLRSDRYLSNELHRFGGINSIRGFNENSLQASLLTSLLTEYRYLVTSNLYVHTLVDYGYYEDKATNKSDKLYGLGFGFGLLTKNGLFNLVYANGNTNNQEVQLSNSIVHISLKATF